MRNALFALVAAFALSAPLPAMAQVDVDAEIGDRTDVISTTSDDVEMNAAYAKAQETLPEFLRVLANPPAGADTFSIKFPLGGWEHIWVRDVRYSNGVFTGKLDNVPLQEDWSIDDLVEVPRALVSDWGYYGADGVMRGNYTTRVLLNKIDPQTAAAIRRDFGW